MISLEDVVAQPPTGQDTTFPGDKGRLFSQHINVIISVNYVISSEFYSYL